MSATIYDFYETKDGEYLSVGSLEPQFWSRFCTAIGREDLIGGTVYPPNIDEVKAEIRGILKKKTRDEWVEVFSHYDACVQPVLNLKEALLEDEQVKEREMVVDVKLPLHEDVSVKQLATAVKLSECPCEYKFAGYPAGYHTQEVIEQLGMDYAELKAKGVFD